MSNVIQFDEFCEAHFKKIFEVRPCPKCGGTCEKDHADHFEHEQDFFQCRDCSAYFRRYDFERAK